ncbi:MAG: dTMP kinase [Patescibacteria group bacterium]|jgi:dTMP kinase
MNKNSFITNPYKGLFIAFEGLDGSGLSTQADLLNKYLNKQGYKSFATKEPTNNIIGGLIRGLLTHIWKASNECSQLLFTADRALHLEKEIIPALKKKNIIITDRYFFSTVAFGSLNIRDLDWLVSLNQHFILPDIIFLIKVPPKECVKRIKSSRFSKELFEEEIKLKKIWRTYNKLAKIFPNIYVIDGNRDKKEVFKDVFDIVVKKLKKK